MKNLFKRIRNITLILFSLEIISFCMLFLFYYYDVSNFKTILTTEIVFYIFIGFEIFNILFFLLVLYRFYQRRYLNYLQTEEIFGNNIKQSFNFSRLGIVVVNDNQEIIWVNDILTEKGMNLIDENILDLFPSLREFQDNSETSEIKIKYNDKSFLVSYLKTANVYFFKDNTDLDNLYKYSKEQSIVLGIIMIDNYNDLKSDEESLSDLMANVKIKVLDYFKMYGVLLRKYSNDSYYAVCNYDSLIKMQEKGFEILDEVKTLGGETEITPTLSIGFAYDFPNVLKLNEMVNNAIDIAISRGGDQVVISKYGDDLQFYGGRSETIEKRNKVKVRVLADSLIALLKTSKNVFIMGHTNTDLDAIGSCLGILAICERFDLNAKVVFDPKLADRNTKLAITSTFNKNEYNEIFITPKEALNKITSKTLLVCCDFHKPSLALSKELLNSVDKVLVIDHHRRSEEFIDNPIYTYIETSGSSASELVAELIKYSSINPEIKINPAYATLMLSGIFLDTNFYKSSVCGIRTFEASMVLKSFGADNLKADEFLKDDYEERLLISKIISTIKTPYTGVVYCLADQEMFIDSDTLSKAANECEAMKGVNASFSIGRVDNKTIKISARSDGSINVQILCEKLGGGGHFNMAAATFNSTSISEAENLLLEYLRDYLDLARNTKSDMKEN